MTGLALLRSGLVVLTLLPASALHAQEPAPRPRAPSEPQRPYRLNDWFEKEEIQSVTFSPSGEAVAFTRLRPAHSQLTNGLLAPETRSDVWLQEAPGRPARNLTQGQADSSGWWAPLWSPGGEWLVMLASRGGSVTLWGWERARNQVRQLSRVGVDRGIGGDVGGCRWVDTRRLLCMAMPEGEPALPLGLPGLFGGEGVALAEAAWAKAKRGERSVSVVSSVEFKLPARRLLLVDVTTGTEQVIAPVQMDRWDEGGVVDFLPSPGVPVVAVVPPQPVSFQVLQRAAMGNPVSIELRYLDGRPVPLDQSLPANVVTSTMQWSPDGKTLAFFALGNAPIHPELLYREAASDVVYPAVASKEYPGRLWRVDLSRGRVEPWSTGHIDLGRDAKPPAFTWTAAGELLFRTHALTNGARPLQPSPAKWLVLARDGRTRPLTKTAAPMPDVLQSLNGGRTFVGLAEGELWSADPERGTSRNLTARLDPPVLRFELFDTSERSGARLLLHVGAPDSEAAESHLREGIPLGFRDDYVLDPRSGAMTRLPKPRADAILAAFAPVSQSAAYRLEDRTGTFLWRSHLAGGTDLLVAANTFLSGIAKPESRYIDYISNNGERLKALLHLPYGYQAGRRYPLVVDSDIGATHGRSDNLTISEPSAPPEYTASIWAAAGYAYMFTSWPSTGLDSAGRANLLLGPNGVLPAVDEAIRRGIADPERVFLYGASSMGYGAYGLVTQTNRFRAAVAAVGWVDQASKALGVPPVLRYSENPFEFNRIGAVYSRFFLPVWRNAEHLRRNSPLSYVDRVQTPLMLIGGDMDYADHGTTQAEMFFSALVQQRKPAELVRYWGEAHMNQTPANLRDYWQRVVAWFDRWGDISRDADGGVIFDGDTVRSRGGTPALSPEDYARFPLFSPVVERSRATSPH